MSELPDRVAEIDAAFKLLRWVYAFGVMLVAYLIDEEQKAHAYIWVIALLVTATYCGDCFIAWLRLRQRNNEAVKLARK